jgi:hypothetical protein
MTRDSCNYPEAIQQKSVVPFACRMQVKCRSGLSRRFQISDLGRKELFLHSLLPRAASAEGRH